MESIPPSWRWKEGVITKEEFNERNVAVIERCRAGGPCTPNQRKLVGVSQGSLYLNLNWPAFPGTTCVGLLREVARGSYARRECLV